MEISTNQIKELRDKTGISIMQCRKALEEASGDMDKAIVILQKKSKDISDKKAGRQMGAAAVQAYIHSTGNVGTMVELSCETDFVSKNEEFKALAYDIAMHITATNPEFINKEDISEDAKKVAREVFLSEVEGKPENIKEKILQGKMDAYFNEKVLMEQPFIKNPDLTIRNLIESAVQKFGEKTVLTRFVRFSSGKR